MCIHQRASLISFQVHPEGKSEKKNMKAAMARLASSENLTNSYDLVLGLVRRPQHSPPRTCRHNTPSTPPPSRHHHCACHVHHHHHCNSSKDRHSSSKDRESRRQSRSRPSNLCFFKNSTVLLTNLARLSSSLAI